MRTIKAAEIVIDYTLYPRNSVDEHNVRCIMDAIRTGERLPPVLIDKKSKRVVDGVHRIKAHLRLDEDAKIEVAEKDFKNDAAIFLEAMRLNADHGAKLDSCDRTHCLVVAERLKINIDAVAGALHMPKEKLGNLRNRRIAKTAKGLAVPLKRTLQHMAGRRLTKQQIAANERSSGMNQAFYVNQLVDLIEAELLDQEDEKLLEALRHLHGLLDTLLPAV